MIYRNHSEKCRKHRYLLQMDANSTDDIFEITATNMTLVVSMSVLCACSIICNVLVIVTVSVTKKLRTITSVLLLNLNFCDLCIGVIMMPLAAHGVIERKWIHNPVSCIVVGTLINALSVGSIATVSAIALDRYFAIIHCFRYSSWTNWKYPTCVLSVIWLLAFLNGIPPLFGGWSHVEYVDSRFTCLVSWERHLGYAIVMFITSFLLPLFIMMFCYLRIIRVARLHSRKIGDINTQLKHNEQNQQVSTNGIVAFAFMDPIRRLSMLGLPSANIYQRNNNGIEIDFYSTQSAQSNGSDAIVVSRFKREAKAILRLVSLIFVFLICWTPFVYTNLRMSIEFFRFKNSTVSTSLKTVSFWLIALHGMINPLIYAIVSRRFRISLRRLIRFNSSSLKNSEDNEIQLFNNHKTTRCLSAPIPRDSESQHSGVPEVFTIEQFLADTSERYQNTKYPETRPSKFGRARSSSDAFRFGSKRFLEVPGLITSNNSIKTTSFIRSEDLRSGSNSTSVSVGRRESLSSIQSASDSVFSNENSRNGNTVTIKFDLVH